MSRPKLPALTCLLLLCPTLGAAATTPLNKSLAARLAVSAVEGVADPKWPSAPCCASRKFTAEVS